MIVFADTEDNETGAAAPDGRADEAYVVDKRTGQVVSAAHLDPASGTWVDADGRPAGDPTGRRRSMTVRPATGTSSCRPRRTTPATAGRTPRWRRPTAG